MNAEVFDRKSIADEYIRDFCVVVLAKAQDSIQQ